MPSGRHLETLHFLDASPKHRSRDGGIENVDDKIWVPVRISQPLMNFLYSLSIAVANINTPADIMVAAADSSTSKENLDETIVSENFFEF